jgi:predicted DNA-binding WGR domain protein
MVTTMTKKMFELSKGGFNKGQEISVNGSRVTTRYGRIGSDGQASVKTEGTVEKAQLFAEKVVREPVQCDC